MKKKNLNKNNLKIWVCIVSGKETIIKIFKLGWIPIGFSQRGLYIQMCTNTNTHKQFIFSLKHNIRVWGAISWVEYFRRTVLFWSPAVMGQQSFFLRQYTSLYFVLFSWFLIARLLPYLYGCNIRTWRYRLKKNRSSIQWTILIDRYLQFVSAKSDTNIEWFFLFSCFLFSCLFISLSVLKFGYYLSVWHVLH